MQADVIVIGAGLAGLVTTLELLEKGRSVLLLDRGPLSDIGGLARWSFGGIFYVDSPLQRKRGIRDSEAQALQDWFSYAEFEAEDHWPKQWAEQYVSRCTPEVYEWLKPMGIRYIPFVQWVERGLPAHPGNSVPRFHMVWGTGAELVRVIKTRLAQHPQRARLVVKAHHQVTDFLAREGRIVGVRGLDEASGEAFEAEAMATVIAAGGITGSVDRLKNHWYAAWGSPPETLLTGSHPVADGQIHEVARQAGAHLTHLHKQWNYASGVHHPDALFPGHGLSLVPPKSALWLNYRGERIGDPPLVSGFDTRYLVEQVCQQEKKFSWQLLNRKIALKELNVSGSLYNDAIREQRILAFAKNLLLGNQGLLHTLTERCEDFLVAESLEALAGKMNSLTSSEDIDPRRLRQVVEAYDRAAQTGDPAADPQQQLIAQLRSYRGDRMRTLAHQPILDPKGGPLIAIREFVLARKSLGGILTDLHGRVLSPASEPIEGLYAAGESAGFGGGGIHGLRALEGTFLGNCIFNGRVVAKGIEGK
jgi:uncharacterized protein